MPFMIINHGAPGTGKSTFSKEIANGINATICSTDDFFTVEGVYEFDPKKLGLNHNLNYEKAENCCKNNENLIIDNTNCSKKNYKMYEELAEEYNYTVYHIYFKPNPELSIERNSHNVPIDSINRFSNYLVNDFMEHMKKDEDEKS